MINFYKKLHEYGLTLNTRVTADGEHVRFYWVKNDIPGGAILSFWELENMSPEAIESYLIYILDDYIDLIERLEEN